MSVHIVGNPNDYGGDDDPPEHGRDTVVFQDLQPIRRKYAEWLAANRMELFNDDMVNKAELVQRLLDEISDELNTPF